MDALYFLLNPYITTGISRKKIEKQVSVFPTVELKSAVEVMEYLKNNSTGSDENIANIQFFIKQQNPRDREFYKELFSKTLKIGCDGKTVNKVIPDLIPHFDVMLAMKYYDHPGYVEGKEFIITQKLDGLRCCIIKENGVVSIYSRQGQVFKGLVDIEYEANLLLPDNMVYDGELILRNDNNLLSKDLYRATMKVARKDGVKKNLIFNMFDMLPFNEFQSGESKFDCRTRKQNLNHMFSDKPFRWIQEVPVLYIGKDISQIDMLLNKMIEQGNEGIMVNLAGGKYQCKRSKEILKVKKMQTADVLVLDLYEGDGENKGVLGAALIQFEHKGNLYMCKVGSGFSKEQRRFFWKNPDKIKGKIIEISYFEISTNQNDKKYSLRFPVFKHIRDDKTKISMY